ncbi:MAG: flagellar hook-associated protein FlgK [Cognatishimia sp.]
MSLSGSLYAAASGLSATQGMSRVTAGNVANAMTPGYVRREAILVSSALGTGGVHIGEIRREVDAALVRMSRNENSKMAEYQALHEGLRDYTVFLGDPSSESSLNGKFSEFNSSLTTLVNMPSSMGAQQGAVFAAEDLTNSIRETSNRLAGVRNDLDMEIRYEIADLNESLYKLHDLNLRLADFEPGSLEAAGYHDQVDQVLDQISGIADIRVTYNADGWVNVYTTGGAALLEGDRVHDVTFEAGDGTIMAGDNEITPNKDGVRGIQHGSLAGLSTLKLDTVPKFQLQLDEFARGLIQAFEGADASLSAGQAGLFTDNGFAFDASNLDGLASRLRVNDAVHAGAGGSPWLIRDGLGATAAGPASDSTQIQSFIDAMGTALGADSATGIHPDVTLGQYMAEMVTSQGTETSRAERSYNAAKSAAEVVQASRKNVEGVNIDEEMQRLLMIEQSFAANSKMLTAVAEMLDTLLAAV